jgi:hypothetical protein
MTGDRKVTLYNNKSKVVWTIPFSGGFLGFEKLIFRRKVGILRLNLALTVSRH